MLETQELYQRPGLKRRIRVLRQVRYPTTGLDQHEVAFGNVIRGQNG